MIFYMKFFQNIALTSSPQYIKYFSEEEYQIAVKKYKNINCNKVK